MLKEGLSAIKVRGNITYITTVLIVVVMPMHYQYIPPLMIILFLGWIFENYNGFGKMFGIYSRYKLLFIAFVLFYIFEICSLLYTNDLKMGWSNIFTRLSFIVFPLLFFSPGLKTKNNVFTLLRTFSLSTLVYILTCFGYAFYRSVSFNNGTFLFNPHPPEFDWQNYFYGQDLTYSIHPSYLAMFVMLSVFISIESFYDISVKKSYRIGWLIVVFFLLISIYFISSRAAILAVIVVMPFYAIYKIFKFKKGRILWLSIITVFFISLPLIRKNDRVNNLLIGLSKEKFDLKRQDDRIIIWGSAVRLIRQNMVLGVGIGDVRTELANEYLRIGENKLGKEKLNAHNQFLEILLEEGLIGFSLFISILIFMVCIAINEKNLLYGLFILMMLIFFMFETVLYRLAGIAFFSLFSFLLLHLPKNEIS